MTDFREFLMIIGALCRMIAFLVGIMAVRHVMLKGMVVKEMPVRIRVLLYLTGLALGMSAVASMLWLAGMPFAPEMRELTHIGVSCSIIVVSILVMMCPVNIHSLHGSVCSAATSSTKTNGGLVGQSASVAP